VQAHSTKFSSFLKVEPQNPALLFNYSQLIADDMKTPQVALDVRVLLLFKVVVLMSDLTQ